VSNRDTKATRINSVEQQANNKVIFIIGHLVLVGLLESRDHKFMSRFKQVFNKLQTKFMTFSARNLSRDQVANRISDKIDLMEFGLYQATHINILTVSDTHN